MNKEPSRSEKKQHNSKITLHDFFLYWLTFHFSSSAWKNMYALCLQSLDVYRGQEDFTYVFWSHAGSSSCVCLQYFRINSFLFIYLFLCVGNASMSNTNSSIFGETEIFLSTVNLLEITDCFLIPLFSFLFCFFIYPFCSQNWVYKTIFQEIIGDLGLYSQLCRLLWPIGFNFKREVHLWVSQTAFLVSVKGF